MLISMDPVQDSRKESKYFPPCLGHFKSVARAREEAEGAPFATKRGQKGKIIVSKVPKSINEIESIMFELSK